MYVQNILLMKQPSAKIVTSVAIDDSNDDILGLLLDLLHIARLLARHIQHFNKKI